MWQYRWMSLKFILLLGGIWWCIEAVQKLRGDLAELRRREAGPARAVILAYWIATAFIAVGIVAFGPGAIRDLWRLARF